MSCDAGREVAFRFLLANELCRCACVCRQWCLQSSAEVVWRPLCAQLPHWRQLVLGLPAPTAKQAYAAHVGRLRYYASNATTGFLPPELCRGPGARKKHGKKRRGGSGGGGGSSGSSSGGGAAATLSAQFRSVKKRLDKNPAYRLRPRGEAGVAKPQPATNALDPPVIRRLRN